MVKIQSEIDGLKAQKTTLENWLTNLKKWVAIQVGNKANEKSATKNLEGKGSARYKDEIAELQTQIDELQTKINEVQTSYAELSKTECQEPCNLVFGGWFWTSSTGSYPKMRTYVGISNSCSWTADTTDWLGNPIKTDWLQIYNTSGVGSGYVFFSLSNVSQRICYYTQLRVTASDGTSGILDIRHSTACPQPNEVFDGVEIF